MAAALAAPYPSSGDRWQIVGRIVAADREFAGRERAPEGTREALAKDVERLLAEATRRGLDYPDADVARRDVAEGPPKARPGYPIPLDNRAARLSIHAGHLLRLLARHPDGVRP